MYLYQDLFKSKIIFIVKLLFHLVVLTLVLPAFSQGNISHIKTPSWVEKQQFESDMNIETDKVQEGIYNLLADYQINIPEEQSYFRLVTEIMDSSGIQSASTINASFDPNYQKLFFHEIKILRDGKIINKLKIDNFQLIRREMNAENYLYDGSLSAILNMSDVRTGDIIDMSYTIEGFNPIHQGKYANSFALADYVDIHKINIVVNAQDSLNFKVFNSKSLPKIKKVSGFLNYSWTVTNPEPIPYEDHIPASEMVLPLVAISQFKSWNEVIQWGQSVFDVHDEDLNEEVKAKIIKITKAYKEQSDKIKLILSFVQNDIRYLGFENGISAYQPNKPNKVFEQRFGDCKDKSLLLVQLLKEIGVEAYPMLVNTDLKGTLLQIPASPIFFNHCAVKVIDEDENILYYDPTIFNQGGTHYNTHFPNYEYGLVLQEGNKGFDSIVSNFSNHTKTYANYDIQSLNGPTTLEIKSVYSDVEADRMRNLYKSANKKTLEKEYENLYTSLYTNMKMLSGPEIRDDYLGNRFQVTSKYQIDNIWQDMLAKKDFVVAQFTAFSFQDMLYAINLENRVHPLALPYPTSKEHITKVKLPKDWNVTNEDNFFSNDNLYFEYNIDYELIIFLFLKTLNSIYFLIY